MIDKLANTFAETVCVHINGISLLIGDELFHVSHMILKIVFFELASKQAGFEAGEDLAGVEIVEDNEGEVAKV